MCTSWSVVWHEVSGIAAERGPYVVLKLGAQDWKSRPAEEARRSPAGADERAQWEAGRDVCNLLRHHWIASECTMYGVVQGSHLGLEIDVSTFRSVQDLLSHCSLQ